MVFICGGEILKQMNLCPRKSTEEAVMKGISKPARHGDHNYKYWAFWKEHIVKLLNLAMAQNPTYLWACLPPREIVFLNNHIFSAHHCLQPEETPPERMAGRSTLKGILWNHLSGWSWVTLTQCSLTVRYVQLLKGLQEGALYSLSFFLTLLPSLVAMIFVFFRNIHIDIYMDICEFFSTK